MYKIYLLLVLPIEVKRERMNSNYEWLNHVCDNLLRHENWYDEQVILFNPHKVHLLNYENKYIDACDIVGITHDGYCQKGIPTWWELLENLKRFSHFMDDPKNKSMDDLINLIHRENVFPRDGKSVYELDNCYYICSGHHRLTLAKFLSVKQIKVEVIHVRQTRE